VRDAHLPDYQKGGFPVAALVDLDVRKAANLADRFQIPLSSCCIEEAIRHSPPESVFDVAVPASGLLSVLHQIPNGNYGVFCTRLLDLRSCITAFIMNRAVYLCNFRHPGIRLPIKMPAEPLAQLPGWGPEPPFQEVKRAAGYRQKSKASCRLPAAAACS
jgi:hypothetical protein